MVHVSILLIHGGAGDIAADAVARYEAGLARACDAGSDALARGMPALDGALAAVEVMEADPDAFNAGRGGAPTRDGTVELDAAVMTSDGRSGAVAAVRTTVHAARLARTVMEASPHALLVAQGADALVAEPIENEALLTPGSRAALARWRESRTQARGSGTVGAVTLDDEGRLAAVTSTGGMLGQWPGRVGDSPLIGAGTYADERVAVSCTGKGEAFMRCAAAVRVALAFAGGATLERALGDALGAVARLGGDGGIIAVTSDGSWGVGYTSPSMAYAWRAPGSTEQAVRRAPGVRVLHTSDAPG